MHALAIHLCTSCWLPPYWLLNNFQCTSRCIRFAGATNIVADFQRKTRTSRLVHLGADVLYTWKLWYCIMIKSHCEVLVDDILVNCSHKPQSTKIKLPVKIFCYTVYKLFFGRYIHCDNDKKMTWLTTWPDSFWGWCLSESKIGLSSFMTITLTSYELKSRTGTLNRK